MDERNSYFIDIQSQRRLRAAENLYDLVKNATIPGDEAAWLAKQKLRWLIDELKQNNNVSRILTYNKNLISNAFPVGGEEYNKFMILFNEIVDMTNQDGNKTWKNCEDEVSDEFIGPDGLPHEPNYAAGCREWVFNGKPYVRIDEQGRNYPIFMDSDRNKTYACGDNISIAKNWNEFSALTKNGVKITGINFNADLDCLKLTADGAQSGCYYLSCGLAVHINCDMAL
jgi:hypothetical protein